MLKSEVHQTALDQAKADASDPFVFARVKSHIESGFAGPGDYSVDFRNATFDVTGPDGRAVRSREFPGKILTRTVQVAQSVKRP